MISLMHPIEYNTQIPGKHDKRDQVPRRSKHPIENTDPWETPRAGPGAKEE